MRRAVYPGSFDPVTFGHLDIIRRSATLVDELVVGVLNNSSKTPLFSVEERVNILLEATKDIPNVRVESFSGLSVDFAKNCGARFIVRGLRAITDFDYELQLAQTNRIMNRRDRHSVSGHEPGICLLELFHSERSSFLRRRRVKVCTAVVVVDKIYNKIWSKQKPEVRREYRHEQQN